MTNELTKGYHRFRQNRWPSERAEYEALAANGQKPHTLVVACSDSRADPALIFDTAPGELFVVRNVGNFVPPFDASEGYHGTAAAIEYAVLALGVHDIVVCGHSHCGAVRALYAEVPEEAHHMRVWLNLGRDAVLPVTESPEALRRTEQRSVILQLERLMAYPMVMRRVEQGTLFLHGWYYVIEEGQVRVLDVERGEFVDPSGQDEGPGDPLADVALLQ